VARSIPNRITHCLADVTARSDFEKSGFDLEKLRFDLERLRSDLGKLRSDLES
jgi:hypothetical protein